MRESAPARTGGLLEQRNRRLRIPGQRQRQAGVGGIEQALGLGQQQLGLVILALRDLDQRELEDDLRLGCDQSVSESR